MQFNFILYLNINLSFNKCRIHLPICAMTGSQFSINDFNWKKKIQIQYKRISIIMLNKNNLYTYFYRIYYKILETIS